MQLAEIDFATLMSVPVIDFSLERDIIGRRLRDDLDTSDELGKRARTGLASTTKRNHTEERAELSPKPRARFRHQFLTCWDGTLNKQTVWVTVAQEVQVLRVAQVLQLYLWNRCEHPSAHGSMPITAL